MTLSEWTTWAVRIVTSAGLGIGAGLVLCWALDVLDGVRDRTGGGR